MQLFAMFSNISVFMCIYIITKKRLMVLFYFSIMLLINDSFHACNLINIVIFEQMASVTNLT